MPELTRRSYPERHHCGHIYFGDVERAHMISGRLNKIAAFWVMIGAVLAVISFFLA